MNQVVYFVCNCFLAISAVLAWEPLHAAVQKPWISVSADTSITVRADSTSHITISHPGPGTADSLRYVIREREINNTITPATKPTLTTKPTSRHAKGGPLSGKYVPGVLLVKFRKGVTPGNASNVHAQLGATVLRRIQQLGIDRVALPAGLAMADALQAYRGNPDVEYAEPDYLQTTDAIPNDTFFSQLWGLTKINAPKIWDQTTGTNVIVAVIDSGVDWAHPDLDGNIWSNPDELPNGIDDDGNGYIDDVRGWDFYNDDNDPTDDNGHGTHCAGTIAAEGNNGIGVAGVNWSARIMPLKASNHEGSLPLSATIDAVVYAIGKGARIINASYGGTTYSAGAKASIEMARDAGVLFVAAAGNEGNNNEITHKYPSDYDLSNIISVASTEADDDISAFSNYGVNSVDLAAPGGSIISTMPGGSYASMSGTSMATPHVAGVAALVYAQWPWLREQTVKQLILDSVDEISALNGKVLTEGRLNANSTLRGDEVTWLSGLPISGVLAPGQVVNIPVAVAGSASGNAYLDLYHNAGFDGIGEEISIGRQTITVSVLPSYSYMVDCGSGIVPAGVTLVSGNELSDDPWGPGTDRTVTSGDPVVYRFTNLDPDSSYQARVTYFEPIDAGRVIQLRTDEGTIIGVGVPVPETPQEFTLELPSGDLSDGTIDLEFTKAGGTDVVVAQVIVETLRPRLVLDRKELQFSDTMLGESDTLSLAFSNVGTKSLSLLSNSIDSDAFTVHTLPTNTAPGASGTISIFFHPQTPETVTGKLILATNDPSQPTVSISLSGGGIDLPGVIHIDTMVLNFDSTLVGRPDTMSIAVKNMAGLLNVTDVSVLGNYFSLSSGPGKVVSGDSLQVKVVFSPAVVGLLVGEVSIHHSALNYASPIVVPLQGSGVDAIPFPSLPELKVNVPVKERQTTQITISNHGNAPIRITTAELDSSFFAVTAISLFIDVGHDLGVLDVLFAPDDTMTYVDTLMVHHNGSGSPLQIPLFGTGTPKPPPPKPKLVFGQSSIDAGSIQLGGSAQHQLKIRNAGKAKLLVSAIRSNLGFVTFSPASLELAPGFDTAVTLTAAPKTAGPFSGVIEIIHNAEESKSEILFKGLAKVPEVGFSDIQVDFGPIQEATKPELIVTLVNNSPNDLNVTGIDSDGPFSTDTSPFTLSRGDLGSIPVTFLPDRLGTAEGVLRLVHDNPFLGPLEIPLLAEVIRNAYRVKPSELFFVVPETGQTARDTLSFWNLTDSILTVTAAATEGQFSVDPQRVDVAPGLSQDFAVNFMPNEPGKRTTELVLTHNAAGSPPLVLPMIVEEGEAGIVFGMDDLHLGTIDVGDTASVVLRIGNPGSDTLFVVGVGGDKGHMPFRVDPDSFALAPEASLNVNVRFTPAVPGFLSDSIVFDTNVGLGQDLPPPSVTAQGLGRGPQISVAPDRLFFASPEIGVQDTQRVNLTNVGNDTLRVLSIRSATSFFTVDPTGFALGQGASVVVEVVYLPDSVIGRSDTLTFSTNIDSVRIPLVAAEIPKNVGNAKLMLTRLDSLISPQVGDTISLGLELLPGGDAVTGVDLFVEIPNTFLTPVDPTNPFTREGLTTSALVLINTLKENFERGQSVASLSTYLFAPQTSNGILSRIDLVVLAPLEQPAPVAILSEFPVHNSQYITSNQAFSFQASPPAVFGNLPPKFLSLPLLETEEDKAAELFMSSYLVDPDGPLSEIKFTFEPSDSLWVIESITLQDSLVSAVFFPPQDANGIFPVTVVATDGGGASDTSMVLIDVAPENDAPIVGTDTVLVRGGGFVRIPLLNYAMDIDGDSITVSTVMDATEGTVELNENNTVTYTPDPNFQGEASFSFVVDDGNTGESTGQIVLIVSGTNQSPVIAGLPALTGVVDSAFAFALESFKSDPDDSSAVLAWSVDAISGPVKEARIDGDFLEVLPLSGRIGEIRLLLTLIDPFGAVQATEMMILIEPRTVLGDFNEDFEVGFEDFLTLTAAWRSKQGEERYVPLADLNSDGEIELFDFLIFAPLFIKGP